MTQSESPLLLLLVVALILVVGALVWLNSRHRAQARAERLAELSAEADAWIAARARLGPTPISTHLILKNDEHAVLEEQATLLESRAYRVSSGGATRIRRVYVGGGVSDSHQRLKQIDQGTLTLTTKRLIFDGSGENRSVQLTQVMSVGPWADAIEVSTERRAKSQIYSGLRNPLIWTAAVRAFAAGRLSEIPTTDNG